MREGDIKLEQTRKLVGQFKFIYIYIHIYICVYKRFLLWFVFWVLFVFGENRKPEDRQGWVFQSPPAVLGRWGPADADDVRQDTLARLAPWGFSWSGVWLTVAVPLISALFMLLSQQFISHFIPHSFIPQYISADGIDCSNDSLWGRLITECRGSYWYQ